MINPICIVCKSPAVYSTKEGVWRHKGPATEYFAQSFCDKYGHPIKVEEDLRGKWIK